MSKIQEDRAKAFREQAQQDYPESWRPDEGAPSDYGPKLIIVVRDETGKEWSVWAIHAALLAALRRERPKPGELIYIDQQGTRTSNASGRQYTAYKVKVDRPVAPDFDQFAGEEPTDVDVPATDVPADTEGLNTAQKEDDDELPF